MAYTPEYSDELLALVAELYSDEIKPHNHDLRLLKMLDLIELAQTDFEQYKDALLQKLHIKCLKMYIVGLFLVYLVIPESIQFQIKNKNYELFLSLKQLYDRETNMANVKLQVVDYLGYLSTNDSLKSTMRPGRSFTMPSLTADVAANLMIDQSSTLSPTTSAISVHSQSTTDSSLDEDVWSPPEIQPKDQLKLADGYDSSLDSLVPELPSYPAPNPPRLHHTASLPLDTDATVTPESITTPTGRDYFVQNTIAHRKDSYQSVYAEDSSEDIQQISPKQLLIMLQNSQRSIVIFDIRPQAHFEKNHIPFPNVINLDPILIAESENYPQLEQVARTALTPSQFMVFQDLHKYDDVIYYSDASTSLLSEVDFLAAFDTLLKQRRVAPKLIKGGFESWTKYLSRANIKTGDLQFKQRNPPAPSIPPPAIPYDELSPRSTPSKQQMQQSPYQQLNMHSTGGKVNSQPPPIPPPVPPPHMISAFQRSPPIQAPVPYPTQHYYSGYIRPAMEIPVQQKPVPQLHHQEPLQRQRINSRSIPTIQSNGDIFIRLSITGLRNMGNTCYINSMIQCLFASSKFREIFLDNKFEDYMNLKFDKTKMISPMLSLLFKKMFLNGACSIVPSGFLKMCIQLRPDLKIPTEQQDTQEFLMFLLDELHEELNNSNVVVNDYPELMYHDFPELGEEYGKWFDGYLKQGLSPVSKYFQGQLQDCLHCQRCGFKSSNFSTFYMLSLVIPKVSHDGKKLRRINLEDCIRMFTEQEVLSGENAWDCPECSKRDTSDSSSVLPREKERKRHHRFGLSNGFKLRGRSQSPAVKKSKGIDSSSSSSRSKPIFNQRTSIKSLTFVILPPTLIIHLSRFLFYDTSQKDTAIVTYPLILDIPHMGTAVHYKLFGVVNHHGTLKSGHYTSITNKNLDHDLINPNWYYFDDEVVKSTNHGSYNGHDHTHMSSSDVYVLFYERM